MASKKDKGSTTSEWSIARTGISLLLNNKTEEAEALFTGHPHSFHVKAGRCFVLFMNALMSFEDDKLQQAMLLLRDMERECANDIGWLKSMKNRVFKAEESSKEYVNKLERQIVLADSQVCSAILTLLQQELTGYVRGGWMLRKAWRVYQHAYMQISQLYRRTFGTVPSDLEVNCSIPGRNGSCYSLQSPYSPGSSEWSIPSFNGSPGNSTPITSPSGLRSSISMFFSITGITSEQQTPFVEPSEVTRLMSAVSFGYGIYQLCVSLLPPSLLKLIHFLGFEGDRRAGLTALMYARVSEDMRAPLATLSLLWYHTIVRPFFALDGSNVKAGVNAAKQLIEECRMEFQNSALFLFFAGRVERLESNVNGALEAYDKAVDASSQREVRLLCLHEVAWCHLIRLSYEEAYRSLTQLQQQSRWSKSFYAYLAAVCCGSNGKFEELMTMYRKIVQLVAGTTKETQLGLFILRRAPKLVDQDTGRAYTILYYKLLVYELLYLWNAMPSCSIEALRGILLDCKGNRSEEPMVGLADLIEGATYLYLGDKQASIRSYRSCLKRRNQNKDMFDQHVTAFALYELGSSLCTNDNIEEGKSLLLRAQTQYRDYDFESRLNMSVRNAYCCVNGGNCQANVANPCLRPSWYQKFIKPLAYFIITSLIAMSVSHLCDKYSASSSFKIIKADLGNLRRHLNTLSMEVKNVLETRDNLQSKLKEVGFAIPKISEAILKLRDEVTEGKKGIGMHTENMLKAFSPESVRKMVQSELQTYDADKTGMTDYALETLGGTILSIRNTETYSMGSPIWTLFGIPICTPHNTPRTVIQIGVLPGECWAFKGSSGTIVIQLLGPVYISGISLEHISSSISPTGETTTAPKEFSVWGLECLEDTDSFLFGEFIYDNTGLSIQYFEVQNTAKKAYEIVEVKIHSNNGNRDYTCVYRIRVHGTLRQ